MNFPRSALAVACLLAGFPLRGPASAPTGIGTGEAIYRRGVLASGAPLEGTRDGEVVATGSDAACVNCHQRSGLGSLEGRVSVPPITGEYLFQPRTRDTGAAALPYAEALHGNRDPYTEETLARAIRDGVDSEGRPLDFLMPRFALGADDMAALVAYLRGLDVRRVPGVTDTVLHFATIVTPDADPARRQGTLQVLEEFFAQKNRAPLKPSPAMLTSGRTQYAKSMYMANRHWKLHVWELDGPPSGWRAQLEKRLAAEPVYAVLSGVGGSDWAPVHAFCEAHSIPCLFPNVDVPVDAEGDFYPVYFSRGVILEARLVARDLLGRGDRAAPAAVEQVYRAGDSGEPAAAALAAELRGHGTRVRATVLPASAKGPAVVEALRRVVSRETGGKGAVVLWLRPDDLAALREVKAGDAPVYVSGILGGLERSPLPAGWRRHVVMTYPFDLPERRGVRLGYPLGWFSFRHIPVVAEQAQTDAYLACSLVAETLNRMADNFVRPYLLEQLQDQMGHRVITGYYPRLTLATNQRFASKGGYLVRFRDPEGTALVPEGDWTVP